MEKRPLLEEVMGATEQAYMFEWFDGLLFRSKAVGVYEAAGSVPIFKKAQRVTNDLDVIIKA